MNDTYHLNVLNIIIWKYHCGFNSSFDGFFFLNIEQLKEDNMVNSKILQASSLRSMAPLIS